MSFDVITELNDKFIVFKLIGKHEGKIIEKELVGLFDKIIRYIKEHDCKNVLIDASEMSYRLVLLDKFHIGEYIAEMFKGKIAKIACLRCADHIDDFTETVAYNRGAEFRFFNNKEKAIKWLLE